MLFTFLSPSAFNYCQFLLAAAFMFYQVNANTKLANAKPLPLGKPWGQVPGIFWSHFHQPVNTEPCDTCIPVKTKVFRYILQIH